MILVQEYPTVTAADSTLPVLQKSEDAKAFATFPNFSFVVHPEFLVNSGVNCIQRATGQMCPGMADGQAIPLTNFPNGAPGFDLITIRDQHPSYTNIAVAPTPTPVGDFSMFFATYREGAIPENIGAIVVFSGENASSGPRLLFRGGTSRLALYNGSTLLASEISSRLGEVSVYMITYSDSLGTNLYRNNELVASSPTIIDPVPTTGFSRFMPAGGVSAYAAFTNFLMSGFYSTSIDLSRTENFSKRAAINNYLMTKYGAV